jgi:hypothetical protein
MEPKLKSMFEFPGLSIEINDKIWGYIKVEHRIVVRKRMDQMLRQLVLKTKDIRNKLVNDFYINPIVIVVLLFMSIMDNVHGK